MASTVNVPSVSSPQSLFAPFRNMVMNWIEEEWHAEHEEFPDSSPAIFFFGKNLKGNKIRGFKRLVRIHFGSDQMTISVRIENLLSKNSMCAGRDFFIAKYQLPCDQYDLIMHSLRLAWHIAITTRTEDLDLGLHWNLEHQYLTSTLEKVSGYKIQMK